MLTSGLQLCSKSSWLSHQRKKPRTAPALLRAITPEPTLALFCSKCSFRHGKKGRLGGPGWSCKVPGSRRRNTAGPKIDSSFEKRAPASETHTPKGSFVKTVEELASSKSPQCAFSLISLRTGAPGGKASGFCPVHLTSVGRVCLTSGSRDGWMQGKKKRERERGKEGRKEVCRRVRKKKSVT